MPKESKTSLKVERVVNKATLARLLDVTPQTISDWSKDGCPNEGKTGRERFFDVARVVQWRIAKAADSATGDDSKARKLKAEADRLEMQNAETRGELVSRDDVQREAREEAQRVKQGFMNIPPRIAQQLASESNSALCEAIVLKEITQVLDDISKTPIEEAA